MNILITQPNCTPCESVKKLLDAKSVPYEVFDISSDFGANMKAMFAIKTTPFAIINGVALRDSQEIADWVR